MLNGRKSYSHTFICVAATLLLIFGYSNCVFAEGKAGELGGPSTSAGTHGVQTSTDGKQVEPKVTKPGQNESQAAAGATTTTTSNETRSSETPVPADGPKTVNSVTGTVSNSTQSSSVNQTAANNETEAISNSAQSSNVNQKTGNIETTVSNSTQTTIINRTTGNNETTVSNSTQTSNINQTTGNNETTVLNSTQTSNINQTTGNNGTTVSNSTQTSNINQTTGNNETTVSNSTQTSNINQTTGNNGTTVSNSTQISNINQTTGNNETTVSNSTQTINVNHTTGNNETTVSNSTQSSSVNQTTGNNETATVSNSTQSSNTNQTADTAAQVLSIFLVNDLQYDIFPVNNESGSVCYTDPEAENCVGGLPSLEKFMDDHANVSDKIWLNAGNTLGGDLFRTLKFDAAVQAMKLLNFNAMAVGPSVFKYGGDAGKMYLDGLNQSIVVSNIDSVQQRKSVTLTVGICNVSVIGYLENTELDKDIPAVKNATQSVLDEITRIRNDQKNVSNLITVVIGSSSVNKSKILALNETVDFVFFSGANWSEEADKSKGKLDIPQFFHESVNKSSNKTAYVASLRVNHSDVAGRFIVGLIQLPIADSCRVANANFTVKYYNTNTTNNTALDLIKLQLEVLQRQNESLRVNNSNNLTAERDLCINSECSLGNLITDAMVAALNLNGTWSENFTRIGIFPAVHLKQNTTIPEGSLTVMNLAGLLDQDAYIYSVLLTGRQLKDILEVSINSSSNSNSTDFLHVSRLLQIEYRKDRSNKSEIISVRTVLAVSSSMQLSEIDVNSNATFYNVSVPFMLFRMDSYKKLLMSAVKQYFHSVTIVGAVTEYINNTGALFLPVIGSRFIRSNLMPPTPTPPPPPNHCADHTGTTVAVTLVVAALIVGLIFGVWRWRSIRSHLLPGYVNF